MASFVVIIIKLRISAHHLHIEKGSYSIKPVTCAWCQKRMGPETVEDESHVLFACDMC